MRVCFLHVPKTAGTSTMNLMSSHFGRENVFQIVEPRLCMVPIAYLMERRPIIAGHLMVRYLSNQVLKDSFVFTFLRDPVERLLSQYYYYRGVAVGNPDPNTEYARTQALKDVLKRHASPSSFSAWANWQTCIFAGCGALTPASADTLARAKHNLEQLAFVGVQEEFALGAETLLRAWGADGGIQETPRLNQTKERLQRSEIDDETRTLIEENNSLDHELYLHARKLWKSRHTRAASPALITNLTDRIEEGSKEIEIIAFAIEGDSDSRLQVTLGQPWTLLLTLRSRIVEKDLTVGVKISDELGLTLYGTNSCMQNQRLSVSEGEFVVRIEFAPVALSPATYRLTAALHTGLTSEEKLYHWVENAFEFEVASPAAPDFIGMIDLSAKFSRPIRAGSEG